MINFIKNKNYSIKNRKYHLSRMNEPALLARQDAAYDRSVELLSQDLFSYTAKQRSELYKFVLKLLDVAVNSRLGMPSKINLQNKDPISQYLLLLRDTINAAYAMVTHEVILFREEKQLTAFIGAKLSSQIRSADEIFTNSELNICHCAKDLIDLGSTAILKNREKLQKSFRREEITRYKKTLEEYKTTYSKYKLNSI